MEKIPETLPKQITDLYETSRNTFIRKDKGEVAEEREVEIGDVNSDDFQPQVKLKQWDNETNFSVRLIDDEIDIPTIETEGNKIKFIKNKLEAHFYNTKIGEKKETDAYEFEVILKEKPKTNKVQMSIETKGLKFYYQPSLKEEHKIGEEGAVVITDTDVKDKDGKVIAHRPENVVGSYAVYHESKQGDYSKMGKKNYRAGKAFHIYRPKIIDSAGTEVWGKLNITDNLLSVEIPQEFLDNAVYPVRHAAGLTFGYESVGGSSEDRSSGAAGTRFTSTEVGNTTNIRAYFKSLSSNSSAQFAIYKPSDYSRVAYSSGAAFATTAAWYSDDIVTAIIATDYYLCFADQGEYYRIYYDTGTANYAIYEGTSGYNNWENPFPSPYTSFSNKYSIYCTYTAGGGGTNMKINIGDVFKDVSEIKINIGDAWKTVSEIKINIGDVWKTIFSILLVLTSMALYL